MSEIKDKEECYLILRALSGSASMLHRTQELKDGSEPQSEKVLSLSKASKQIHIHHATELSNLPRSRRGYYFCPYFVGREIGAQSSS